MTQEQYFNQYNVTVKHHIDGTRYECVRADGTKLIMSLVNWAPAIGTSFEVEEIFEGWFGRYPDGRFWKVEKVIY